MSNGGYQRFKQSDGWMDKWMGGRIENDHVFPCENAYPLCYGIGLEPCQIAVLVYFCKFS